MVSDDILLRALKEKRRRVGIRNHLHDFVKGCIIDQREGWIDGAHIRLICETVQTFLESSDKRILCLSMPPRHMKSVILSNALPCWWILKHPQDEIMLVSYGQELARENLRACRQLMHDPSVVKVFGEHPEDVSTADAVQLSGKTNGRPNLVASGVGGGLTGKGCNILVVDDPIKDAMEAESETYRRRLVDWFNMVATSRLAPGGKVIIVATRWTYNDLIAYEIENVPDMVEVLNFPAISDEGLALWPERFSVAELLDKKRTMGSREFEAQYQGRPTPAEGGLVKRDWLQTAQPNPPSVYRVRAWDMAATEGGGDWTSGCLMSYDSRTGAFVVEDMVHIQKSPAGVEEAVRSCAMADGMDVRIVKETEGGSAGVTVDEYYARHVLVGHDFHGIRPTGPKDVRARPMIAALENGTLRFASGSWTRALWDELLQFPLGAHDDQVDAMAYAYNELVLLSQQYAAYF